MQFKVSTHLLDHMMSTSRGRFAVSDYLSEALDPGYLVSGLGGMLVVVVEGYIVPFKTRFAK